MTRVEKTVFISYRRADRWAALAVFKDLTQHGFDAFIDYDGIPSGDFEGAILDNIRSRAHFVVLLTPTALERCNDPADWLRREIEAAIAERRNIVPVLLDGFDFGSPLAVERLQGPLEPLKRYQALPVPKESVYFDTAMELLRGRYLSVAVEAVMHAASVYAKKVAREQREAASRATSLSAIVVPDGVTQPSEGLVGEAARKPQDEAEAVKWYRKAAEQGYAAGQAYLANKYERGVGGLTKNLPQALTLYRQAAAQGNDYAQNALKRLGEK